MGQQLAFNTSKVVKGKATPGDNLFNPNGLKVRKFTRKNQVILDPNSVKGYRIVNVNSIHSKDYGATYVGKVDGVMYKRVGMARGFLDNQGRTAGRWQKVA